MQHDETRVSRSPPYRRRRFDWREEIEEDDESSDTAQAYQERSPTREDAKAASPSPAPVQAGQETEEIVAQTQQSKQPQPKVIMTPEQMDKAIDEIAEALEALQEQQKNMPTKADFTALREEVTRRLDQFGTQLTNMVTKVANQLQPVVLRTLFQRFGLDMDQSASASAPAQQPRGSRNRQPAATSAPAPASLTPAPDDPQQGVEPPAAEQEAPAGSVLEMLRKRRQQGS